MLSLPPCKLSVELKVWDHEVRNRAAKEKQTAILRILVPLGMVTGPSVAEPKVYSQHGEIGEPEKITSKDL